VTKALGSRRRRGVPLPPEERSGQGAVSLPKMYFKFWLKQAFFVQNIFVLRQKGDIAQRLPHKYATTVKTSHAKKCQQGSTHCLTLLPRVIETYMCRNVHISSWYEKHSVDFHTLQFTVELSTLTKIQQN